MLKKFEVKNFKGFDDWLVFDLSAREYAFNRHIVYNGIVNKAIVYGKNGIGKSSLGIALFDIVDHLTDKEKMPRHYLVNYRNLHHIEEAVTFRYHFQFEKDTVLYEYQKIDVENLVYENLSINGEVIISYNYFSKEENYLAPNYIGNLNVDLVDNKLSVIKYIYRNTPTNSIPLLTKMVTFCENMLWYRGLSEGNNYAGFTNGGGNLIEFLYEYGKIHEFEDFLRENGMEYSLKFENLYGKRELFAIFDNGNKAPFISLASTGTMSLLLFFAWSISAFQKISFLFIDEFDAFFHYESAENIVLRLNAAPSFQTVLTTHNTYLMQNKLTRPDCCFIMSKNKLNSLYNATDREIREAHNLEKMYINGAFKE